MDTSRLLGPCSQMHSWAQATADFSSSSSQVCRRTRSGHQEVRVRGGYKNPNRRDAPAQALGDPKGRALASATLDAGTSCLSPMGSLLGRWEVAGQQRT